MKIMNIGFNALNDIGSNYYVKLNEKELLIYEEKSADGSEVKDKDKSSKPQQETKTDKSDSTSTDELTAGEERLVLDLQARDTEVRAHEAAHQAAGGGMTGAASYTYQQAPDGKMYAIGGEVFISMKSGSTPEETIANARQIATAAMAAGNPSPQDFAVASSARIMEMKAEQQLAKERQEEVLGKDIYKSTTDNKKPDDKEEQELFDISA